MKLPDLLIEVDNQLGFTRNFLTPAQREEPSPEDICAVLAAVMAHGCNLGCQFGNYLRVTEGYLRMAESPL